MDIKKTVLMTMDDLFGIDADEMNDNLDLDLFENELIDSLGLVTLLEEVGDQLDIDFDISDFTPENFRTVNEIIKCIEKLA